jgi:hypothetical protein
MITVENTDAEMLNNGKILIEALIYFKDQITTAAFSNMTLLVVTLGWLITSESARKFLNTHKICINYFIALIIGIFVGFVVFTYILYGNSCKIYDTLKESGIGKEFFQHYAINYWQIVFYIIFELLVCMMIIRALFSIKSDKIEG